MATHNINITFGPGLTLSRNQQLFIDKVKEGCNIFLTGKAGSGKSHVTREVIKLLQASGKKIIALAPTGIAANNVGGQTIHSMFSINPFGVASFATCNFLKQEKRRMLDAVDVILIDEVSMLRPDVLDAMNWTLLKNGCSPLHSKQIIFIGDLKQLPSPINDNTRSVLYQTYDGQEFYWAKVYNRLNVQNIELDEVLRQSNEEFIHALNIIREGGRSEYFRRFVATEPKGIILAPHNTTVDRYNRIGLDALPGQTYTFHAKITGNVKADDFNLPTVVSVKQGAKIMYLANQMGGELINGTLGIFVSHSDCHYIRVGNVDHALAPVMFSKKEYVLNDSKDELVLRELGTIEQYPIKLAFALSIHKSQGLTFDEVTVDLTRSCFSPGMLYVALSRVTAPEGLRIITA